MTENIIKLKGQVKQLIDRPASNEPQQVQIFLLGADLYYDELGIPNTQQWQIGDSVEVTIRSHEPQDVLNRPSDSEHLRT